MQQEELTVYEVNAILSTEQKSRSPGSVQVDYPDAMNVHFVRIAHLYVKIYVLVSHCLDICGLHDMTVSVYHFFPSLILYNYRNSFVYFLFI